MLFRIVFVGEYSSLLFRKYEKVISDLEFDVRNKSDLNTEQKQQGKSILLQTYLNLAACEEKLGNPNGVLKQCNKGLELDSINVKVGWCRWKDVCMSSDFFSLVLGTV